MRRVLLKLVDGERGLELLLLLLLLYGLASELVKLRGGKENRSATTDRVLGHERERRKPIS